MNFTHPKIETAIENSDMREITVSIDENEDGKTWCIHGTDASGNHFETEDYIYLDDENIVIEATARIDGSFE